MFASAILAVLLPALTLATYGVDVSQRVYVSYIVFIIANEGNANKCFIYFNIFIILVTGI